MIKIKFSLANIFKKILKAREYRLINLKLIIGYLYGKLICGGFSTKNYNLINRKSDFNSILSAAKHEAHRLEKAYHANMLHDDKKLNHYKNINQNLQRLLNLINLKYSDYKDLDLDWCIDVHKNFPNYEKFYQYENKKNFSFTQVSKSLNELLKSAKTRRSVRKLHDDLSFNWHLIGEKLVNIAKWSPCSGNRQPLFFKIITNSSEKDYFMNIKEKHMIEAPLLILVGVHSSSYGVLGKDEKGIYIDGAAASMSIVNACHTAGISSCWNHFAVDLIFSRLLNYRRYLDIKKKFNLKKDFVPISIISIGLTDYKFRAPERKSRYI